MVATRLRARRRRSHAGVRQMAQADLDQAWVGGTADEAMVAVLRAEREAQVAIALARREAQRIGEAGRAAARALAERTERHIRCVVAAFERQRRSLTDELDAQAAAMAVVREVDAADTEAVARAVQVLARQLTGGAP